MVRFMFSLRILVSSFLLLTFLLNAVHASKKCYIVYLGAHSHGSSPSYLDLEAATYSHHDLLSSVLGSHEKAKEAIIYSYNKHINGFAALLEEDEAARIAKIPNVVSVFLSKAHKLQTTRSWEFLGLHRFARSSAWQKGRFGENIIIGNIDTGVWPESRSFSDKGFGAVPSKWRGGHCQIKLLRNPAQDACNRKLIGAKFFSNHYEAYYGRIASSIRNARDFVGHGTHTLSTAGGNFVPGANAFGSGNGTAKGGSPRARVAAYKVCWSPTDADDCFGADILSAIDQAISDGVDVISMSIIGTYALTPETILTDEVSIGAFHALAQNIVVVAAAGNDGPEPGTVENLAPWLFTVAASTIDRVFSSIITLGNNQQVEGASLFVNLPPNQSFRLIEAVNAKFPNVSNRDARLCRPGTLNPALVRGNIVNCLRGPQNKINSVAEGQEARSAGARGMVLNNDKQSYPPLAEPHVFTCVNKPHPPNKYPPSSYSDSDDKATIDPTIKFSPSRTRFGIKAPVMASFSSRGPNRILPSILKPDVTAPGVDILAAFSLAASPSNLLADNRPGVPYNVLQGTSMSTPHVAGIAGLVKQRHPNWSPAAIKSAIMTTATTRDNRGKHINDDIKRATPFAYGSGHVQPNLAIDPGLVYDLGLVDYLNFLCALGYNRQLIAALNFNRTFICKGSHRVLDLNYPSITLPLPLLRLSAVNVTRTVTNVGPPSTYNATANLPGFNIVVVPNSLTFTKIGEKKTFQIIVRAQSVLQRGIDRFGELLWTNGRQRVGSPIVIPSSREI